MRSISATSVLCKRHEPAAVKTINSKRNLPNFVGDSFGMCDGGVDSSCGRIIYVMALAHFALFPRPGIAAIMTLVTPLMGALDSI